MLDEADAHQLFQNVADYYWSADSDPDVPESVRLVVRLWNFLTEVSIDGVNDYLWNYCHSLNVLQKIHAALQAIHADELCALLEAGVCSDKMEQVGEFWCDADAQQWAAQFCNPQSLTFEQINRMSMQLAYPLASELVAAYIRSHRSDF